MKIILPFLLALFVLTGCTTTNYSVQKYEPMKNNLSEKIVKKAQKIISKSEELQNKIEIENHTLAIVFPSYTWHRVTPVTKGSRYSLVIWNLGKPYK